MNKIKLTIFSMFLPLFLFGQQKGFYISVCAIGGSAKIINNLPVRNYQVVGMPLYMSGELAATYMFTNHSGIALGIGEEMLRFTTGAVIDPSKTYPQYKYIQNYLTIPVYFRFVAGEHKRTDVFANLGAKFSTPLTGKQQTLRYNVTVDETDTKDDQRKLMITPFLAVGIRVRLSDIIGIDAGPELQINLRDFFSSTDGSYYYSYHTLYPKVKSMPFGVRAAVNVRMGK